jgi:hypothetical protein
MVDEVKTEMGGRRAYRKRREVVVRTMVEREGGGRESGEDMIERGKEERKARRTIYRWRTCMYRKVGGSRHGGRAHQFNLKMKHLHVVVIKFDSASSTAQGLSRILSFKSGT